jgi:hypothetical protein
MNISRRIAALKREIDYRRSEIERIAKMRAAREPSVLAFPRFVDKYLDDIEVGIEQRETEILRLENSS